MNKEELIKAAAQEAVCLSVEQVTLALECVLEVIVNRVSAGEYVEITTFGSFSSYEVPPDATKSPISYLVLPRFKSSKAFERSVYQEARRRRDKALAREAIEKRCLPVPPTSNISKTC